MKTKRIAILGPESSGKTTLADSLAKHYNGFLTPEYARSYLSERDGEYSMEDLVAIANRQFDINSRCVKQTYLIADTEMLTIKIWSEVKFNNVSSTILNLLDQQEFDLYLLCKPDIPWKEDPLREHPHFRNELFDLYSSNLEAIHAPYKVISGDERFRLARKFCDQIS